MAAICARTVGSDTDAPAPPSAKPAMSGWDGGWDGVTADSWDDDTSDDNAVTANFREVLALAGADGAALAAEKGTDQTAGKPGGEEGGVKGKGTRPDARR